ncbi:PREDICTED: dual specificity protein phosphatase 3-like [Priapulus caudatus]|uniref:Dual specificity protein phosphatase n=1 Tax=Priapulus caudatus TaxID=37621 RepID=A0ABM1DNF5_PRICU|nr:PREDICTED: dual specificity protein phosphatase 3-like [Priapulus caudatus]
MATETVAGPCTLRELKAILTAPTGGVVVYPTTSYDEVYLNLFIGDEEIAHRKATLRRIGITHVINAGQGETEFHVNTNAAFYVGTAIRFLGIEATDMMSCDMTIHFQTAATFIEEGLREGKVLVHCREGISRSATVVLAFLILRKNMTVQEAVRNVRRYREINPNDGFLQQLCDLNAIVFKSRCSK